jgi:hypothetical protein
MFAAARAATRAPRPEQHIPKQGTMFLTQLPTELRISLSAGQFRRSRYRALEHSPPFRAWAVVWKLDHP